MCYLTYDDKPQPSFVFVKLLAACAFVSFGRDASAVGDVFTSRHHAKRGVSGGLAAGGLGVGTSRLQLALVRVEGGGAYGGADWGRGNSSRHVSFRGRVPVSKRIYMHAWGGAWFSRVHVWILQPLRQVQKTGSIEV